MLVDAAHFYVSCERVFQAALHNRATVVLSNNDGCLVAVSPEAKKLGLKRGQPLFQCQKLIRTHDVQVFSSNYALYASLSTNMMCAVAELAPRLEIYSIDESFAELTDMAIEDFTEFGRTVQVRVYQHTGIPVRVAIAATKCLTKITSELLKSDQRYHDVLDLTQCIPEQVDEMLGQVAIEEVWGIGTNYARFLRNYGIQTARDLRDADERWIKKTLTVVGARIQLELRGTSCMPLEVTRRPKQQIVCAKTFGRAITNRVEMEEAVSTYTAHVAEKLREQDSLASRITVFVRTNSFATTIEHYANEFTIDLPYPTAFTPDLIRHALEGLHAIYREGYQFRKAGVALSRITPLPILQPDLFGEVTLYEYERQMRLMAIIDAVNRVFGRDTLIFASQGLQRAWRMRQSFLSGRFTSRWDEILTI